MAFAQINKLDAVPVYTLTVHKAPVKHPYLVAFCLLLILYISTVRHVRFRRINNIKKKYGFTSDLQSYKNMTMEQAQEIEQNLAEWDFPFLYEFGWLFDFMRVKASSGRHII